MKCSLCDGKTEIRRNQKHHYLESGLDNVYLVNIDVEVCTSCMAKAPIIPKLGKLHEIIARALILQPSGLSGKESRFLRKHLGIKAKDWAALLRVDPATVSRWENGENPIGAQSDSLIRLLYVRLSEEQQNKLYPDLILGNIADIDGERIPPTVSVNIVNLNAMTYSYS